MAERGWRRINAPQYRELVRGMSRTGMAAEREATMRKQWMRMLAAAVPLLLSADRADAGTFFLDLVSDDGNVAVFDVGYDPETDILLGSWTIDIVASPTVMAIAGTQDDTGILGTGNFPIGLFSDTIRQPDGIRYGNASLGVNVDVGTTPVIVGTLSVTYNGVATEIRSENVSLAGSAIVIQNNTPDLLAQLAPAPVPALSPQGTLLLIGLLMGAALRIGRASTMSSPWRAEDSSAAGHA